MKTSVKRKEMTNRLCTLSQLILLRWLFSFIAVCMAVSFSLIALEPLSLAFWSLLATLLLAGACCNRKTLLITGIVLPLVILLALLPSEQTQPISHFIGLFRQVIGYDQYRPEDAQAISVLLAIVFSLIAAASLYRRIHFIPVGLTFLTCYVVSLFSDQSVPIPIVIASIVLTAVFLFLGRYQTAAPKMGEAVSLHHWSTAALAVLFSISTVLIALVLPKPQTALTISLQDQFFSAEDWFASLSGSYKSGFSPSRTILGGNLILDSTYIMDVKANEPVYLTGAIYSRYDGHVWNAEDTEFSAFRNEDLRVVPQPLIANLDSQSIQCRIIPATTTKYIFYVGEAQEFSDTTSSLLTDGFGNFQSEDYMSAGRVYNARGIRKQISDEAMRLAGNDYYERNPSAKDWYDLAYEEAQQARKYYMELPENLPERVRWLVKDITASKLNDYDKLLALEHYLCQLSYSLHPGETPAGQDFVDYFLFEQKEGYCNHFASAMTVMSRCLGLPARFVKGYVTPAERSPDGYYRVTNYTAHAWTEVYLNGVGWLAFEPTSLYNGQYAPQVDRDSIMPEEEEYYQNIGILPSEADPSESDTATTESPKNTTTQPEFSAEATNETVTSSTAATNPSYASIKTVTWILLGTSLLLLLLVVWLVIRCARFSRYRQCLRQTHGREGGLLLYKQFLRMMSFLKDSPQCGETLRVYTDRLIKGKKFPFQNDAVLPIFEKILYSEEEISKEEETVLRVLLDQILQHLREKRGAFGFWWDRWILNRY